MLVQEQFHSISEWEKHHREYHQEWKPWNPPTSTRKLRNRKRIKGLNLAKPNSLQSTTMVGIFLTAVFVAYRLESVYVYSSLREYFISVV